MVAKTTKQTRKKPAIKIIPEVEERPKEVVNYKIVGGLTCVPEEELSKFLPNYAHEGDLGADVYANSIEYDPDMDAYIYGTGIAAETMDVTGMFLMPRSSNCKTDAYQTNGIGLIDTAIYKGEIAFVFKLRTAISVMDYMIAFRHYTGLPWYKKLFFDTQKLDDLIEQIVDMDDPLKRAPYKLGDKIGQMVFMRGFVKAEFKRVDELKESDRGTGGFGSSDKEIKK